MCVNDLSNPEKLLKIEKPQNDLIESITGFAENGLAYQSPEEVENLIAHLERAARNNEY